ncbi:uncharacterized protein LOC496031 [Xenopus laevis]|uniref:LOC496031 protein n=3 Tax=Xenopus laevis TaxID=8355 RepID=Q5PPZ8_XENLA|nr:uncharacterized protein LOC496031 [Xenopus laevis]AAH87425.1 LOC496031 protein [Xenopus laevis]OCT72745.1 hypothetical protein XELAEV_18035728mg [Xenopus laevis]
MDHYSGWKIEPKFSNKVLIGNWVEERKKFRTRRQPMQDSCYNIDFVNFPDSKPDWIFTRSIVKKMEGLPKCLLLSHHGEAKHKHLVSHYDDHFLRPGNSTLPTLRSYDGNRLAWVPERSDYPTADPPTNFGLLQAKEKQWREKFSEEPRSLYSASYKQPPTSAYNTMRFGVAPRVLSSTMYPSNNNNKSMNFREYRHLQVPGFPVHHTHINQPAGSMA